MRISLVCTEIYYLVYIAKIPKVDFTHSYGDPFSCSICGYDCELELIMYVVGCSLEFKSIRLHAR